MGLAGVDNFFAIAEEVYFAAFLRIFAATLGEYAARCLPRDVALFFREFSRRFSAGVNESRTDFGK